MKSKKLNRIALRAMAYGGVIGASHAAIIIVPPNYTSAVGTFADTIQANAGGTLVTVVAGSVITGNLPISNPALNIAATGYNITNAGTLSGNGTAPGVLVGAASTNMTNSGSGSIIGASAGVGATTGLTLVNNGTITATAAAGNGVLATTGANSITNTGTIQSTATVGTANSDGVRLTEGTVSNTGRILGADHGIRYIAGGTLANLVINSGTISGGLVGVEFLGAATADTLTMTGGTINLTGAGTTAVALGGGIDTLNLGGGVITGIVDGGAGVDTLNFNDGTATINGNVTAFENFNRNGTGGVATINGTSAVDTIAVTTGSLYLNGNVSPTSLARTGITVGGGSLGGTGTWTAAITQTGGYLNPGPAPFIIGGLTIGNNLSVTGGSLLINMNPTARTNDLLTVSGSASIAAANILVSPTSKDAPLQDSSSRVLDVVGTRTGQYTSASFLLGSGQTDTGSLVATAGAGVFTSSTVSLGVANGIDVNDTNVVIRHNYDTVAGLGAFGRQFGTLLNSQVAASVNNPVLADFLGFLDYSTASTVAGVMNAYEPTVLQTAQAYYLADSREIHRIVEQQSIGDRMIPNDFHVWGNFNYDNGSDDGDTLRYTLGGGGAIGGVNVGVLISKANASIGSATDIDILSYGAYFATGGAAGWQWTGYVGASHADTKSILQTAASAPEFKPEGDGLQAMLSGAYMMETGATTWGPTFGFEYASAEMDGSLTPGSSLAPMNFSADKLESLRSMLGMRADFQLDAKIRPYASVQWAHEFKGESDGYAASFQGVSFQVNSPFALATDSAILRAGMIFKFSDSCFGDVGYLGEYSFTGDGADINGANVGFHASF